MTTNIFFFMVLNPEFAVVIYYRFASPRYDVYCKILVKKDGIVKESDAQKNAQLRRNEAYFTGTPAWWAGSLAFHKVLRKGFPSLSDYPNNPEG